jgi:hypothetical protein
MTDGQLQVEANRLYDQYVRPLESEHWGEYAAISANGEIRLGQSVGELMTDVVEEPGPNIHIFRIGPRIVGRWR